jgi:hypothetical protein
MKRYLLILAVCGSVAAQNLDPLAELEGELRVIDARTEDIIAQITYHRRKELFYEGVIAGVESAEGNPYSEMAQHRRKRWFFENLRDELYYTRTQVCDRIRNAKLSAK